MRQIAPFEPFTETSNLTYIMAKRARAAGVSARGGNRTLHSLRHALATRLLEQQVPIEDISRILEQAHHQHIPADGRRHAREVRARPGGGDVNGKV